MTALRLIPLFGLLWLAYNGLLLFANIDSVLAQVLFTITLPSGANWMTNTGQLLVFIGLIALYFEVFKATRTDSASIVDHAFSMLVFVAFLIEFLVVPGAGNSVFMLLMSMALIDVIAGFSVTIVAARRDLDIGR